VLRLNLFANVNSLDPALANNEASIRIVQQLYEGLVRFDTALNAEPCLAHSWEVQDSGKRYVFQLRTDVHFLPDACFEPLPNSTRRVTAHDVRYSFQRVLHAATASPGVWVFRDIVLGAHAYHTGEADSVTGFQVLNDSTFAVQLTKPYPPFLKLLAMPYGCVVPPEAVRHYGPMFGQRPVGTGLFQLGDWEEGRRVLLWPNPVYRNPTECQLQAVEFRFVQSKLAAFAEFRTGSLDALENLDPAVAREVMDEEGRLRPQFQGRFTFQTGPQLTTEYLGLMTSDSLLPPGHPLRDVRFRRAVLLSIDRAALARYLLQGTGIVAQGFVPAGLPGFSESPHDTLYRPDEARRLLAEAGYPAGQRLPVLELATTPNYRNLAEFLQQQLSAVGIRLVVRELEGTALRQHIYSGQARLWRASWISDYPDAENFLALFQSSNAPPQGPNTTRFNDAVFDALLVAALREPNDTARTRLYHQADERLLVLAPVVPLYYYRTVRLLGPRVRGYRGSASSLVLDLRFVTCIG
jgi:peptide/nickel transport system substrate-binding protein